MSESSAIHPMFHVESSMSDVLPKHHIGPKATAGAFAKSGTCNPHMFATPIMCENVVKSHFFDVVYMEN